MESTPSWAVGVESEPCSKSVQLKAERHDGSRAPAAQAPTGYCCGTFWSASKWSELRYQNWGEYPANASNDVEGIRRTCSAGRSGQTQKFGCREKQNGICSRKSGWNWRPRIASMEVKDVEVEISRSGNDCRAVNRVGSEAKLINWSKTLEDRDNLKLRVGHASSDLECYRLSCLLVNYMCHWRSG
jgi:hypothetical protein